MKLKAVNKKLFLYEIGGEWKCYKKGKKVLGELACRCKKDLEEDSYWNVLEMEDGVVYQQCVDCGQVFSHNCKPHQVIYDGKSYSELINHDEIKNLFEVALSLL